MARPAIQLYSLRHVEEPLETIVSRVGEAGFEGVEFATRIRDADAAAVADALADAGLEPVAAHVDIDALEDDREETVAFYRSLACDRLVVPWLDPEHFESEDAVDATADRLTSLADDLAPDVSLGYHNHDQEFIAVDGRPAFERLIEATAAPLEFQVDLGWVAAAGADPVSLLDRYEDRISLVHLSDADADGNPTEIGEGVLDVDACARAVRDSDVEWAIYEHDDPADPQASLAHGASVLEKF